MYPREKAPRAARDPNFSPTESWNTDTDIGRTSVRLAKMMAPPAKEQLAAMKPAGTPESSVGLGADDA